MTRAETLNPDTLNVQRAAAVAASCQSAANGFKSLQAQGRASVRELRRSAQSPDVGASQLPDGGAELGHRAVVLRAAEQAHVRVGQALGRGQRLAVGAHERA